MAPTPTPPIAASKLRPQRHWWTICKARVRPSRKTTRRPHSRPLGNSRRTARLVAHATPGPPRRAFHVSPLHRLLLALVRRTFPQRKRKNRKTLLARRRSTPRCQRHIPP